MPKNKVGCGHALLGCLSGRSVHSASSTTKHGIPKKSLASESLSSKPSAIQLKDLSGDLLRRIAFPLRKEPRDLINFGLTCKYIHEETDGEVRVCRLKQEAKKTVEHPQEFVDKCFAVMEEFSLNRPAEVLSLLSKEIIFLSKNRRVEAFDRAMGFVEKLLLEQRAQSLAELLRALNFFEGDERSAEMFAKAFAAVRKIPLEQCALPWETLLARIDGMPADKYLEAFEEGSAVVQKLFEARDMYPRQYEGPLAALLSSRFYLPKNSPLKTPARQKGIDFVKKLSDTEQKQFGDMANIYPGVKESVDEAKSTNL